MEPHDTEVRQDWCNPDPAFTTHMRNIPGWAQKLERLGLPRKSQKIFYDSGEQALLNEFGHFTQKLMDSVNARERSLRIFQPKDASRMCKALQDMLDLLKEIQALVFHAATNLLKRGECGCQITKIQCSLDKLRQYNVTTYTPK